MGQAVMTVAGFSSELTRSDQAPVHRRLGLLATRQGVSRTVTLMPTAMMMLDRWWPGDDDVVTPWTQRTCSSVAPMAVAGHANDPLTSSMVRNNINIGLDKPVFLPE